MFENILIINFVLTYFFVRLYFDTLRYGTNSENIINLPSPLYKKNADFANYPSVCVYFYSWERRVDPRGRVYYVDHNTRTTTWQRPNTDMLNNYSAWQDHRNNRNIQLEHLQNRFLFPNPQQVTPDNDPLGSLPEGWGKCFNSPANHTPLFNLRLFTVESLEFNGSNFWVDCQLFRGPWGHCFVSLLV